MVIGDIVNPLGSVDSIKTQLHAEFQERLKTTYKEMKLIFFLGFLLDAVICFIYISGTKTLYLFLAGIVISIALPFIIVIIYWYDKSYFRSMLKMLNWNTNYLISLCKNINGELIGSHLYGTSYFVLLIKGSISEKQFFLTYKMGYPPFRWLEIGIPLKNKIKEIDMTNKRIIFDNQFASIPNLALINRTEIEIVALSGEPDNRKSMLENFVEKDPLYIDAYQFQVLICINNFPKSDFMDTSSEPVPMNELVHFLQEFISALNDELKTRLVAGELDKHYVPV